MGKAAREKRERWRPFVEVPAMSGTVIAQKAFDNGLYTVFLDYIEAPAPFGLGAHVSVRRNDREPVHDWRDLQRIKDELLGPEVEAVELYPANSRVVDAANQYHLWAFIGYRFPFGFEDGYYAAGNLTAPIGSPNLGKQSKQRPFRPGRDAIPAVPHA